MEVTAETVIAGKPLSDWSNDLVPVPGGFAVPHLDLKGKVGLYCAVRDGQIVYIGRATELKSRGLFKRLNDFRRDGDSGRKHYGGRMIHEHRHTLELRVLVTGEDRKAVGLAKLLRGKLIDLHQPVWNVAERKPKLKLVRARSAAHLIVPVKRPLAA